MRGHPGFFEADERRKDLSAEGDGLERLAGIVDFDLFRTGLARARTAREVNTRRSAARSCLRY